MNPRMQMKYLLGRQFYIFADVVKTPKDDKQILSFMETLDKANGLLSKSFLNGSGNIVKKIANKMAVLEPKLAILDETDSGLDIDALRIVANGVNALRRGDRSMILVTHYQRLLTYIVPDKVHVLLEGRIVKSGGKELALELEEKGYAWVEEEIARRQAANS